MKKKKFIIYVLIIGSILLILSIYRASTTGITWDEAFSYLKYVNKNPFLAFKGLFINGPGNGIYTEETVIANNHMLNSFFISILTAIFGFNYNILLIRLPNIIFYIIFFIFSYLLSKEYKHNYLCFNLLVFNYGIHEYFGLARGYGIACCLVLISLYYLKQWMKDPSKYKYLNITYLFLAISCYASTTCLLVFASIIIITQAYIMIKNTIEENIHYILNNLLFIIPIAIITILIILFHFHVTTDGFNLYGGENGFFQDTVLSLIEVYGVTHIKVIITISIILFLIITIIRKKQLLKNPIIYGPILYFIILILLTVINNQLWFTNRLLIPSIPLFMISIYEIVDILEIKKKIMIPLIVISMIPFIASLNLNETRDFKENYIIKDLAYKSYETKNSIILKPYIDNYSTCYYRNKIISEKKYDIYKGIYSFNKLCDLKRE